MPTISDSRHSITLDDGTQAVITGATVEFGGECLVVVEQWLCACSGGHLANEPTPKCYRKGGEWAEAWVRLDGTEVVREFAPDHGPTMVRDWGWRDLGGDMYAAPGF